VALIDALARIETIQSRMQTLVPPASAPATPDGVFALQLQQSVAYVPPPPLVAGSGEGGLGEPTPYDDLFRQAAAEFGVPAALVKAVARAESSFNPQTVSHAGAQGLMQLMPATARSLGVSDPFDPAEAIRGGAKYLSFHWKRFDGDLDKVIAAYNAGGGAVERHGGIPPYAETQAYVPRVRQYMAEYQASGPTPLLAPSAPIAPALWGVTPARPN
jgi:peptidoglycan DL-endopeptidase CwlO